MVRITEDLIRKKAEHNEMIISTLEELSLHQSDIEKIEHLDKWCRDLQILYLQSNLIPKIENLGRLKKVKYINLALNNIERIENLEGCESLEKLDLTVNFVGRLTDIERLRANLFLKEVYLTGNPAAEFEGYRDFVIATLPNLARLDGVEVQKSERILAVQSLTALRPVILHQQANYQRKREREKQAPAGNKGTNGTDWYTGTKKAKIVELEDEEDIPDAGTQKAKIVELEDVEDEEDITDAERDKRFWDEPSAYTPESRIEVHNQLQKQHKRDNPEKPKPKKERMLQASDGRIMNVNEPKVNFAFSEDDKNIMLDVAVYKFLDTSLCEADVQPTYVKVWIKGQLLQLTLPEEVKPDSSTAKRSEITGHLLVTMPKLNPIIRSPPPPQPRKARETEEEEKREKKENKEPVKLEIDPNSRKQVDIANIVAEKKVIPPLGVRIVRKNIPERPNSAGFVDDNDVPPLM